MAEVGRSVAASGMSLAEGNAMVLNLLEKYEHIFGRPQGNPGLPLDQVYDMDRLQPVPAWQEMYDEVKADLGGMGLELRA